MFNVVDKSRFVAAALNVPGACHFAVASSHEPVAWPDGLQQARENPNINRVEARDGCTAAFRLDEKPREGVRVLLLGKAPEEPWDIWHWWVYSDDAVLISCYDWSDGPSMAHLALSQWAETLQRDGIIELTGLVDYTDEWFDAVEREHERWQNE